MPADEIEITLNRIAMADQQGNELRSACGEYNCSCHYEMPGVLHDLNRLQLAFEFMASTGTYCVPGRRDEYGKIKGWALRAEGGLNVAFEFSRDVERPITIKTDSWPPWESPIDALLAYRDWLLKRETA